MITYFRKTSQMFTCRNFWFWIGEFLCSFRLEYSQRHLNNWNRHNPRSLVLAAKEINVVQVSKMRECERSDSTSNGYILNSQGVRSFKFSTTSLQYFINSTSSSSDICCKLCSFTILLGKIDALKLTIFAWPSCNIFLCFSNIFLYVEILQHPLDISICHSFSSWAIMFRTVFEVTFALHLSQTKSGMSWSRIFTMNVGGSIYPSQSLN